MRTGIQECKHCGIQYEVQYSGENVLDVPREYQDSEYCPECKKAIVDALATIPVKFKYKEVNTDEVNLETLLRWEQEKIEEHKQKMEEAEKEGKVMFPLGRRIFAGLHNLKTGEHDIIREVIGREDKQGRIYIYSYWSSDMSRKNITVNRRVNLMTGELLEYKITR